MLNYNNFLASHIAVRLRTRASIPELLSLSWHDSYPTLLFSLFCLRVVFHKIIFQLQTHSLKLSQQLYQGNVALRPRSLSRGLFVEQCACAPFFSQLQDRTKCKQWAIALLLNYAATSNIDLSTFMASTLSVFCFGECTSRCCCVIV